MGYADVCGIYSMHIFNPEQLLIVRALPNKKEGTEACTQVPLFGNIVHHHQINHTSPFERGIQI